jgi:hypothetical protein
VDANGKTSLPDGELENKVEKCGASSASEKVTAKTPPQPHNSPGLHHDFTIAKHRKNAKPPAKTTFCHKSFFCHQNPKSPPFRLE